MSLRYLESDAPLERYLEIKAEMKRLEAELKELQPLILAALWEEPEQKAVHAGFELNIGTRRSYAYTDAVKALEGEVRRLKKEADTQGLATLNRQTSFVVVRDANPPD
jgi:hypothetical protein